MRKFWPSVNLFFCGISATFPLIAKVTFLILQFRESNSLYGSAPHCILKRYIGNKSKQSRLNCPKNNQLYLFLHLIELFSIYLCTDFHFLKTKPTNNICLKTKPINNSCLKTKPTNNMGGTRWLGWKRKLLIGQFCGECCLTWAWLQNKWGN